MRKTTRKKLVLARDIVRTLAGRDLAEAEADADPDDLTEEGEEGGEQSGEQDQSQEGEGQSESESESMLGAQPEEMEGEAADFWLSEAQSWIDRQTALAPKPTPTPKRKLKLRVATSQ